MRPNARRLRWRSRCSEHVSTSGRPRRCSLPCSRSSPSHGSLCMYRASCVPARATPSRQFARRRRKWAWHAYKRPSYASPPPLEWPMATSTPSALSGRAPGRRPLHPHRRRGRARRPPHRRRPRPRPHHPRPARRPCCHRLHLRPHRPNPRRLPPRRPRRPRLRRRHHLRPHRHLRPCRRPHHPCRLRRHCPRLRPP